MSRTALKRLRYILSDRYNGLHVPNFEFSSMNSTNDLPDELEALIQIHLWRHWPDELAKGHRVAVLKVGNELRGRLACYMN